MNNNIFRPAKRPKTVRHRGQDVKEEPEEEEHENGEDESEDLTMEIAFDEDLELNELPGLQEQTNTTADQNTVHLVNVLVHENRIKYEYGPLEEEKSRQMREKRENVEAGITDDHTYRCILDDLIDDTKVDDRASQVMTDIYNYERTFYLKEPDHVIYERMANQFNKHVHDHDALYSHRNGIPKIKPAQVRWHMEHCDKRNFKRMFMNDLTALDEIQKELRNNHMFYRETENGVTIGERHLDPKVLKSYLDIDKVKEKKLKQFMDLLEKDADPTLRKKKTAAKPIEGGGIQTKMWFFKGK